LVSSGATTKTVALSGSVTASSGGSSGSWFMIFE